MAYLEQADLAPATIAGYLKDVGQFLRWQQSRGGSPRLNETDLVAYWQHLTAANSLRPATVNRRAESLRRLCLWAQPAGWLPRDPASAFKPMRTERQRRRAALTTAEVHRLLQAAGTSSHGHAGRDYALVQLLVQTGLRVGEVSLLRRSDLELRERSGSVRVKHGTARKARDVPLNAATRRALRRYLDQRPEAGAASALFLSERKTPLPIRSIQAIIGRLARRAHIERIRVSGHTLRHTFAANFLHANPGNVNELSKLLGHESLDTTAVYRRSSAGRSHPRR